MTPDKVAGRIIGLYEDLVTARHRKGRGNVVAEATA
jgi:hypothetical protein